MFQPARETLWRSIFSTIAVADTIFSTKLVCAIFLNKNFYKFVTIK